MSYVIVRETDGTVRLVDPQRNISETVKGAVLRANSGPIQVPDEVPVATFKAGVIPKAA